ncbi:V-set and immunoglobulin domain-containing protein 10-like [Heteronotia binoei]|uniref:V-set and immunoglobulin domain-containing protein 10-like n=1 Tax=Heteronotia binoei TaxID=13085 RepID=UPI002931CDD2|nr:V-set and immunoglobulin domain-containing protein 10-like [Heteronotia binoei]
MARCWHWGTCFSAIFAGWLLALLVPLAPALPSVPLDRLAGDNTFLAIPFSLPAPEVPSLIAWQKDATNLATGSFRPNFSVLVAPSYRPRFSVDPTSGSLNITALIPADSGVYTVALFPLESVERKANITLRVYEEVGDVSVVPTSAEADERDSSVTLTCSPVRGSITWTKDGQTLDENSRFQLSGGSLKINNLQRTDSGTYRCTISNPFSNGTGTSQLTVYYGPDTPSITVSSPGQDVEAEGFVLVNTSVNLTCLAPSQPQAEIYWNVADDQDLLVPSSPSLPLPSVQLNQAGMYWCVAINRRTNGRVRNTYSLIVAQRPIGYPQCSVSSKNSGSSLLFNCSWPGGSPDPRLRFQGLPEDKEVTSSHLEQLVDSPFLAGLSGQNVTCFASHLTGNRSCSVIPEAPSGVFLSFQASEEEGTVAMEMRCQGTFNPAEIEWLQSGQPLVPAGDRYKLSLDGTRLTILNFTTPQDLGNYSARCSNPLGSQSANLTLIGPTVAESTVSRKPNPRSAYITWKIPSGSAVTSFRIQMQGPSQGRSASAWEMVECLDAGNRSVTVTELDPWSSYSFRVVPFLGTQAGNSSHVLTLQAEPYLSAGAIAGIVIGSILGFLLILLLIFLVIFFCRARRRKVPPTPPENQQHYLSRQFPHGRESNEPSWGNPRWSSGDSDFYSITYEEHLRRHGGLATLPIDTRDRKHNNSATPLPRPTGTNVRNATQV